MRLAVHHPAFDGHLRSLNKFFYQHDIAGSQWEFFTIDIPLKKWKIERRPSRIFTPDDLQRALKVIRRVELKTKYPQVEPGWLEITRVARQRGLFVGEINILTPDRIGLVLTAVIFMQTQKDGFQAGGLGSTAHGITGPLKPDP